MTRELSKELATIKPWEEDSSRGYSQGLHSGTLFYFEDPDLKEIRIDDIAHALSNECRFGGHCNSFYSVAQHSLCVSKLIAGAGFSVEAQFQGLMHDATEAYVKDIPTGLKRAIGPAYRSLESNVWKAICTKYALEEELLEVVKWADREALKIEISSLFTTDQRRMFGDLGQEHIEMREYSSFSLGSHGAVRYAFLERFRDLNGRR